MSGSSAGKMTAKTVAMMARLIEIGSFSGPGRATPRGMRKGAVRRGRHCGYGPKVSLKPDGSRAPGPARRDQHVDGPAEELLPFA